MCEKEELPCFLYLIQIFGGRETQPPCNQVNWMIPKMTFDVTQNQIDELKKLKDVHGQNMLNNVRNVQNSS